jgi:GH18 family chitinase/LysM repeat protein
MAFDMSAVRLRPTIVKALLAFSTLLHSSTAEVISNVSSTFPDSRSRTWCPERCDGSVPSKWSAYPNLNRFSSCPQSIYYGFSLSDRIDDPEEAQRIYACASDDAGWASVGKNGNGAAPKPASSIDDAKYQIGSWSDAKGSPVGSAAKTVVAQLQGYLANGLAPVKGPAIVISSLGTVNFGLYIGEGLQNQIIGSSALKTLEASLAGDLASTAKVAMQYCHPNQTADHIFGFIATNDGTFGTVQQALSSWNNASCLDIPSVSEITGPAVFNTPLYDAANSTLSSNYTSVVNNSTSNTNLTLSATNSSTLQNATLSSRFAHLKRADCSTQTVVSGDSCGSLAQKCGISGADFTKYNPSDGFCSKLQVGQHVCCSAGTLPDFAPKPNSDGSCAAYTVVENDNCAVIANKYSLTNDKLEEFNKKTWGWNGCATLWLGTVMCVSSGDPPMPAAVKNAQCGPQKPGTSKPASGTDLSTLNPCPLNACCNIWGQCGVTAPYCTISKSETGAPGTAKKGENGCISNCGTKIIRGSAPATQMTVGFYEGYNLGRDCLYQSAGQVDTSGNTHVMYSFGTFDASYTISVGDIYGQYEFARFKQLPRVKKILSIGGWDFSTFPQYYQFFRNAVTTANRQAFVNSVAAFIKQHNLDGVNIDWEYPGAQDMPGIPAADPNEGYSYYAMLRLLRAALPDKEISICAPASYWYLKGFPIKQMAEVTDYIIYMTYDLHGQWDANNQWAQSGCPSGYCLQSQINITETLGALSMITKAGVPSGKIIPGVTSYGRSFKMSQAGCYGPQCTYTGSATQSNAKPGVCTKTGGYISNAEIFQIISNKKRDGRVQQNFYDSTSASNILVYDDTEYVAYMDDKTKETRRAIFSSLNMGGSANWATDLEIYNPAPARSDSWPAYKKAIANGGDPNQVEPPTGDWNKITCDAEVIKNLRSYTSSQRWDALKVKDAWDYAVGIWKKTDRDAKTFTFSQSIWLSLHGPQQTNCNLIDGTCDSFKTCVEFQGIGAGGKTVLTSILNLPMLMKLAAYELWNSLAFINSVSLYLHYRLMCEIFLFSLFRFFRFFQNTRLTHSTVVQQTPSCYCRRRLNYHQ